MNLLKVLFVLGALPTLAHAEIREVYSMNQASSAMATADVVLFDLDNTVMEPLQTLGTDQWFTDLLKHGDLNYALSRWAPVQKVTRMKLVENMTAGLIDRLRASGKTVMGLTARPQELAETTNQQLKSLNVNLASVIYVGPGMDKGEVLLQRLAAMSLHPRSIVFIDDKLNNVQNVENALAKTQIQHVSFRYSFTDAEVAGYRSEIADVEWSYFERTHEIISDARAATLVH